MIFPNTAANLLANNFAIILYMPPTKLIGLKSFNTSAPCFFGMRETKVALRLRSNWQCPWNSWHTPITSLCTTLQQLWKINFTLSHLIQEFIQELIMSCSHNLQRIELKATKLNPQYLNSVTAHPKWKKPHAG
jgi:hypothetical protein